MSRELVSTLVAAKRYGVSERSIRRYIAQGLIIPTAGAGGVS